ncbi:MAG: tRNA (adenosine(37)-N6)-threonylcarbamoyltransferase complex ATPase subunit type 1 TsaE [Patescibacteria group bacterium]
MSDVTTKNEKETKAVAELMARELLGSSLAGRHATVIVLEGQLGAGKTIFAKGFAKGLGVKEKIHSPTFVLVKQHSIKSKKFVRFYHIDCYRLERAAEARTIGMHEILADPRNIMLIEWASKIKKLLPKKRITITITSLHGTARKISFN